MAKKSTAKIETNNNCNTHKNPRIRVVSKATYHPQTSFGKELMEIRKRIVASGERLLDWDEIEKEVARLRGGHG